MHAWQEGVLALLLSAPQDHWFFTTGPSISGWNSGPANCHSTNLVEPRVLASAAYTAGDYGYGGEIFDSLHPAELVLTARCADCGNQVEQRHDLEDIDLGALFELLATKPDMPSFLQGLRAIETKK